MTWAYSFWVKNANIKVGTLTDGEGWESGGGQAGVPPQPDWEAHDGTREMPGPRCLVPMLLCILQGLSDRTSELSDRTSEFQLYKSRTSLDDQSGKMDEHCKNQFSTRSRTRFNLALGLVIEYIYLF